MKSGMLVVVLTVAARLVAPRYCNCKCSEPHPPPPPAAHLAATADCGEALQSLTVVMSAASGDATDVIVLWSLQGSLVHRRIAHSITGLCCLLPRMLSAPSNSSNKHLLTKQGASDCMPLTSKSDCSTSASSTLMHHLYRFPLIAFAAASANAWRAEQSRTPYEILAAAACDFCCGRNFGGAE